MQNKPIRLASVLGAGILMLGVPAVTFVGRIPLASAQTPTPTPIPTPAQTPTPTPTQTQYTKDNIIAALNNIAVAIGELNALNNLTVEDVQVVNVKDVLNKADIKILNDAIKNNKTQIVTLKGVLNKNDIIKNALNNNNVVVNDVIAIDVLSGGDVVIFTRK
jgi:hypothetical protein